MDQLEFVPVHVFVEGFSPNTSGVDVRLAFEATVGEVLGVRMTHAADGGAIVLLPNMAAAVQAIQAVTVVRV